MPETKRDPPMAGPSWVAADEKQIEIDGEKKSLYAAITTGSNLLLEIDVYSTLGISHMPAFLHTLTEKLVGI